MPTRWSLAIVLACASCRGGDGALLVQISSALQIPGETDRIEIRIFDDTTLLEERSYTIGSPPRDAWPLVQQINRSDDSPAEVTVTVELRKSTADGTLLLVGYGTVQASLPKSGFESIELPVARACDDGDGDDFGLGAGCKGLDCDDEASNLPVPQACPADGGVREDAGMDQLCGRNQVMCRPEEECVRGDRCLQRCRTSEDCPSNRTCQSIADLRVCICNVTCTDSIQCRPYLCDHGCCEGI